MDPKPASTVAAFAKVLRSFHTGGVSYNDFLNQVDQQLAAGASPSEMLEILRRRESVEPLPAYAHTALLELLSHRHPEPAAKASAHPELAIVRSAPPPERATPVEELPAEPIEALPAEPVESNVDLSAVIADAVANARERRLPADQAPPSPEPDTVFLEEIESLQGGQVPETQAPDTETPRDAAAVGDFLANRFALLELIGVGGMSRVFKATDAMQSSAPQSVVAVKVLTRPFSEQSGSFAEFQKEVQKLRSLSHPNIVRVFECDRDGPRLFMTMEYLVGESLYARLQPAAETSIAPREDGSRLAAPSAVASSVAAPDIDARAIITAVAAALDYAHANDVVHGDVKPGNVFITDGGEVKLIDFSIAWWIASPKTALERREAAKSKFTSGVTPRYASPQLMARHRPEIADDVYGLACLAYELCTGIHPFDDGNGSQTLHFPPPMRPGLTAIEYMALVDGLQFERRKRTSTVREFMYHFAIPKPPGTWKKPALWVGLALLAMVVGWFIGHPSGKPESRPPIATVPSVPPTTVPKPPVISSTKPASALPQAGTVIHDCPTCPSMTVLPVGVFAEGSPNGDPEAFASERPQHSVTIASPFALSSNAVTVADFREFVTATGRKMQGCEIYDGAWRRQSKAGWKDPGFVQSDSHPVTCVSWNDGIAYARWLSAKTRHIYRLPSAAEWEYAARAGGEAARPWGANAANACTYANVADQAAESRYPGWTVFGCSDSFVNTAPVGSFKANAFGLNDMLGNVFTWTQDCWHPDYSGAPSDGSARMDGNCSEHELRGGSWFSTPAFVRAPYRNHFAADYRTSSVGLRLVRETVP